MDAAVQNITRFCFGASYAVALLLELAQTVRPRPALRLAALGFGAAGLVAHSLYLVLRHPSVAAPFGSLLLLSWVVAVFYFYGTLHHRGLAWAIFVLPIALLLVVLSTAFPDSGLKADPRWFTGANFWGIVHGSLLFLASVGVCVGGVASLMYLVQAHRLRAKSAPGTGLRLLSLERLTSMNRRAIMLAFPLLTAGLLVGVILMFQYEGPGPGWTAPRVFGTAALWLGFLVLMVARYFGQASNRRLALLTIAALVLLLVTLATAHPAVTEVVP